MSAEAEAAGGPGTRWPGAQSQGGGPTVNQAALWRRLLAEFLGSAFLAAIVIGSGIAAQRYSPDATGLELLENAAVRSHTHTSPP